MNDSQKSYWEKRQEKRYKDAEKNLNSYFKELEKAFEQAKKEVSEIIYDFYARYAEINGISYQEAQRILNSMELGELQEYIDAVNATIGEYDVEVENMSIKARVTRYEALMAQIEYALKKLYAVDYEQKGKDVLVDIYEEGYNKAWFNIDKFHGVHKAFSEVNPTLVNAYIEYPFNGANYSSRLWKQKTYLENSLKEAVTTMITQGKHPSTLAEDFARQFNAKEYDAYRLLHTEASFVLEQASHDAYKQDGVKRYQILATLDSKTCGICGKQDLKIYETSEAVTGVNMPPFHCLCRCTDIPYYEDMGEGLTRTARDENGENVEVPADMTYEEWNKKFRQQDTKNTMPDMRFKTKKDSDITSAQMNSDRKMAISAYNNLPLKVQQEFKDVTFEFGYSGSACDIENRTIRIGINSSEEEIYHEFGHLIEGHMMNAEDVEAYKKKLVDGLTIHDIMKETYCDTSGKEYSIYILKSDRMESEYQSRLYINNIEEALNKDKTINTDVMYETISEPFRKYMMGEDVGEDVKMLIEKVIR